MPLLTPDDIELDYREVRDQAKFSRMIPFGAVLAVLPGNSRVRVLEERGNWVRVRVLSWAGGTPANAPDSGWVNKQFVNTD